MNGILLNIWRENGAYLRFGEAKNVFLLGLSLGLLFSFSSFSLKVGEFSWATLGYFGAGGISALDIVIIGLFSWSSFLVGLSVIPSLTRTSWRVRVVFQAARVLGFLKSASSGRGIVFFMDIAGFRSALVFENFLVDRLKLDEVEKVKNSELIEQIWTVSRIAAYKHLIFIFSIIPMLLGVLVAVVRAVVVF